MKAALARSSPHEPNDNRYIDCITAHKVMVSQRPEVAQPRAQGNGFRGLLNLVIKVIVVAGKVVSNDPVNFADRKAGEAQI